MYNYYINLLIVIDIALLAISVILTLSIPLNVVVSDFLEKRRRARLMGLISEIQNIALVEKKPFVEGCLGLVKKATPLEFLDIARHSEHILPKEFADEFMTCMAVSGKTKNAERLARYSWNKWQRIEALITIGYLKTPHAFGILSRSMADRDDDIVYFSALAMGYMKNEKAAKALFDAIRSCTLSGYRIASILETMPQAAIEDEVIKRLGDKNEAVRFWALKLASRFGFKKCAGIVKNLTSDKSHTVSSAAKECLKRFADE